MWQAQDWGAPGALGWAWVFSQSFCLGPEVTRWCHHGFPLFAVAPSNRPLWPIFQAGGNSGKDSGSGLTPFPGYLQLPGPRSLATLGTGSEQEGALSDFRTAA